MSEWIDCKDRLPERFQRVLIWVENASDKNYCLQVAEWDGGLWLDQDALTDGWWVPEDVTHWRPQLEGPNA